MIDFTSFGKLIPDSVQLHYSLSTASLQLPYSLNSYRSLYPQETYVPPDEARANREELTRLRTENTDQDLQSSSLYGLKSHLPPWNNSTFKSDLVLEFSIKARAQERY